MNYLSTCALLAAMATLMVSCKKDSTAPATKSDLLTAKAWRTTDITVSGQSVYISPFFEACDKDDFIRFNTNKSSTYDQGAQRCDPNDPQTQAGSWELTTNDTKLKLTDPDGDVLEGEIVTLNATTLVLRGAYDAGLGIPVTAELTLAAQ